MPNLFNQYSYVLFSLGILVAVVVTLRYVLRLRWLLVGAAVLLLAALATTGNLILRPGASDVSDLDSAESLISNGNPTLVEFYSNYCVGCIAARAAVDRLVSEMSERFADSFNILRVDIHTDFGRVLRERYGFSYTPEFVLFDHQGEEVWRSHAPPSFDEVNLIAIPGEIAGASG